MEISNPHTEGRLNEELLNRIVSDVTHRSTITNTVDTTVYADGWYNFYNTRSSMYHISTVFKSEFPVIDGYFKIKGRDGVLRLECVVKPPEDLLQQILDHFKWQWVDSQ